MKSANVSGQIFAITNSDLNRPCFAWHPYGKSGLFKTELVIVLIPVLTVLWVERQNLLDLSRAVSMATWSKSYFQIFERRSGYILVILAP